MSRDYENLKTEARELFEKYALVYCPYFDQQVTFNSDGFHHLQFSDRHARTRHEQTLKFRLLSRAITVIKKSGTIQEYRTGLVATGKKSERDGFTPMKRAEYWGLVAIIGPIRLRVVLRRIGDGKIIFWSVMPAMKLNRDDLEMKRQLGKRGIEDD